MVGIGESVPKHEVEMGEWVGFRVCEWQYAQMMKVFHQHKMPSDPMVELYQNRSNLIIPA